MKAKAKGKPQARVKAAKPYPKIERKKFNKPWFVERLRERELSQNQLADRMGVDRGGLSNLFNNKRELQIDEARIMAAVLGIRVDAVLYNAGVEIDGTMRKVKITHEVRSDGTVKRLAAGTEEVISGASDLPKEAFAIQVRTVGTRLAAFDRWTAIVSGLKQPIEQLLNQFVLCGMKDGKVMLGWMTPGYNTGMVNFNFGDGTLENVMLDWVMRVMMLKPSEQKIVPTYLGGDI